MVTAGLRQGYGRVTVGLQQGYSRVTTGLQQGYNRVTTGLQQGYSRVTVGLQLGYIIFIYAYMVNFHQDGYPPLLMSKNSLYITGQCDLILFCNFILSTDFCRL